MARFRHRRFNAKRMVRSENDSVLLPMAHFGIESIAKKDGYPSQNNFTLSGSMARFRHRRFNAKRMVRSENDSVLFPMARFGIELIAKRTDTFLKTTSGPALAR